MNTLHERAYELERSSRLLRDLGDHLQTDVYTAAKVPGLLRILVHVANIQKAIGQSTEDLVNVVKRLRDFANTVERLKLDMKTMSDARATQNQLIESLRSAADQLSGTGAIAH